MAFVLYWTNAQHTVALAVIGPPIYLANFIMASVSGLIEVTWSHAVQDFGVLLHPCLLHPARFFNRSERGFARFVTLLALLGFMIAIHFLAWKSLNVYFQTPAL